jgi:hypothetical protein
MKIIFRQSGGYGGLIRGCEIDVDALPADEAAEVRSLVKSSGILGAKSARSKAARDVFNYSITVETGSGAHQVEFDDTTIPAGAVPLLDYLRSKSGPRPPD